MKSAKLTGGALRSRARITSSGFNSAILVSGAAIRHAADFERHRGQRLLQRLAATLNGQFYRLVERMANSVNSIGRGVKRPLAVDRRDHVVLLQGRPVADGLPGSTLATTQV